MTAAWPPIIVASPGTMATVVTPLRRQSSKYSWPGSMASVTRLFVDLAVHQDPGKGSCQLQGIAIEGQQVGVTAGLQRADPTLHAEQTRGRGGDGLQGHVRGQSVAHRKASLLQQVAAGE